MIYCRVDSRSSRYPLTPFNNYFCIFQENPEEMNFLTWTVYVLQDDGKIIQVELDVPDLLRLQIYTL